MQLDVLTKHRNEGIVEFSLEKLPKDLLDIYMVIKRDGLLVLIRLVREQYRKVGVTAI